MTAEVGKLVAALQRYVEDDECVMTPDGSPDQPRLPKDFDHWDTCNYCRAMEALFSIWALERTP